MTIVYIAGPMTGLPEFNYPAFAAAEADLRSRGFDVRSPTGGESAPLAYSEDRPYSWYLRRALRLLLEADEVVLLPGWLDSSGARLEVSIAEALFMPISEYKK